MPHRHNSRGTFVLDRVFGGVGRVHRASGTRNRRVFAQIDAMLTTLWNQRRADVLADIRDGRLKPIEALQRFQSEGVQFVLPDRVVLDRDNEVFQWIAQHPCSDKHRADLRAGWSFLFGRAPALTLENLPPLMRELRLEMADRPARFNRLRAYVQAFLRHTRGRRHPVYQEVADVPVLRERRAAGRAVDPKRFEQSLRDVDAGATAMAWSMAITGMGPGEYWGSWELDGPGVRIHGTKTAGRDRLVPRVRARGPVQPTLTYRPFRERLAAAELRPYDLRRCYALWMEEAGIPRTRRRRYLGHRPGDITDRYETHDPTEYLSEDARRLSRYLAKARRAKR